VQARQTATLVLAVLVDLAEAVLGLFLQEQMEAQILAAAEAEHMRGMRPQRVALVLSSSVILEHNVVQAVQ